MEAAESASLPGYDPDCYLCPGNQRANGESNPQYSGAFVFDNDFPALTPSSDMTAQSQALLRARPESGCCRVICYTERHDQRLATMDLAGLNAAFNAMIDEFAVLDARHEIAYVQVFENRGQMMGCSNPHPHAQVWATSDIPTEPAKELAAQTEYFQQHGSALLIDYLEAELASGERLVIDSEHSVALLPWWAVWPFETLLLPRRQLAAPNDLRAAEIADLAAVLGRVLAAYDRMFGVAAPYSLGLHPRPSDGEAHPEWQFHIHIYPPLLRSSTIRKHLVGFEMLGMPQRDLTPEIAAAKLRQSIDTLKMDDPVDHE